METQTKIFSVVAAILLLISGYAIVGDDSLQPTHYCEAREIRAFCYSLSSTMKTCYTEINKSGGKRCSEWKKIGDIELVPITKVQTGTIWSCPPKDTKKECVLIK